MTDSHLWRAVWAQKAQKGESVMALSGRSDYRPAEEAGILQDAIKGLDLTADDELLDVGCAAGYTGRYLAGKAGRYTGVDLSLGALKAYHSPRLVQADAGRLPFRNQAFSKSYMGAVLLCMTRRECAQALAELRRVTRVRAFVAETLWGDPPPCRNPTASLCLCFAHVTWFESPQEFGKMAHSVGWRGVEVTDVHPDMRSYSLCFNAVLLP